MPILPHAKKALRASQTKAKYNRRVKAIAMSAIKKAVKEPTQENLNLAYKAIDKAAKRNVFHHNRAARLKSKVARLVSVNSQVVAYGKKTTSRVATRSKTRQNTSKIERKKTTGKAVKKSKPTGEI